MKKEHLYITLFLLFLLVIVSLKSVQENNIELDFRWVEQTEELRKYKDKLDEKGYLTEDDIKEIRKIQLRQMNNLKANTDNKK